MAVRLTIHYDNLAGLAQPHLRLWQADANTVDLAPAGGDEFGPLWELPLVPPELIFTFTAGPGAAQTDGHDRRVRPLVGTDGGLDPGQVWCRGDRAFVYPVRPADPQPEPAAAFLERLAADPGLPAGLELPSAGGRSGFGANLLADGRVQFGLYHPTAARVFVAGSFNDWQCPGHQRPDPDAFVELALFRGWFGAANTWLAVTDRAGAGDEYRFWVQGGTPPEDAAGGRLVVDPYARQLGPDAEGGNAVVVDPTTFAWSDRGWRTPDPADLILYEVSVHGFTDGDPDIRPDQQGRFDGITERIRTGYFDSLGVTALSLMPLAEVPSMQGPQSLGYDPSLYHAVERDFGGPDDLRRLVDAAHGGGLALLVDMVFNHTSNDFNPLWDLVLEQPDAAGGGLYFNGATPWGNRVATEKADVQNLLIDACRMLVGEYHVDGFRLDATHTDYMDHGFLHRLAAELKTSKPDVLLVAENLPNQGDLNLEGWNGYGQWSELFHDKLKALLREGQFEGQSAGTDNLGDAFYFSHSRFAAHTNNVVNYCESHDEQSVPYELQFSPWLDNPAAKERKGRLGMFATLVALGQPMIYMGQEFNLERPRNVVAVDWPASLDQHGFYQWCRRLIRLRRRYPGLRLRGFDPAAAGQFEWILGPWLDEPHGGGRRTVGWRAHPSDQPTDTMAVLLNFESFDVQVDLELGRPGVWVKLADIDRVDDLPPDGSNDPRDPTALHSTDGRSASFTLPGSSGFIYKWTAP